MFETVASSVKRCTVIGIVAGVIGLAITLSAPPASAQGDNLALTATASASGEFPGGGYEANRANDGKMTTRWNDNGGQSGADGWVEYDWTSPQTIGSVVIQQAFDRIKEYRIQSWDAAASDWKDVFTGNGPGSGRIDINQTLTAAISPPVTTNKMRLFIVGLNGGASIWEMEVYAPAKNNLALSATAAASGEFPGGGYEAYRANDGKITTRWNDNGGQSGADGWVEYDWTAPQTFNQVVIKQAFDRIKEYHIQTWDAAASDWKDVFTGNGPGSGRIDINQTLTAVMNPAVTADKMRLFIVGLNGGASIWEMEVYNVKFGTVLGKVLDEAGKGIEGATVAIGDVTTTTTADGSYSLVVDPGTVDVKVTKAPDYKARSARGVVVTDNAQVSRDITLFKSPANLAVGATPIVSSENATMDAAGENYLYGADKLVDNNPATEWRSTETEGATFGLSWDTAKTFNRVVIREWGNTITKLTLQKYDDARSDYVDLQTKTFVPGSGDATIQFNFATPVTAKEIRAVVPEGSFAVQGYFTTVGAYEMEVQNAPLGTLNATVQNYDTKQGIAGAAILTDDGSTLGVTDANGVLALPVDANDYLLSSKAGGYFEGPAVVVTVDAGATGNVVIPLPPIGEDFARKATVVGTSELEPATNAIDNDPATWWESEGTEEGFIAGQVMNAGVELTWASPVTFNRIVLDEFGDRSREILFSVWDAAKNDWVEVGSSVSPGGGQDVEIRHTVDLKSPATTTKLKVFVTTGANVPRFRSLSVFNFTPIPPDDVVIPPKSGDLNDDGKINVQDATLSLRIAVGLLTPTDKQKDAGDVNNDNKLNIQDTTLILQVAVGNKTEADLKYGINPSGARKRP